MYPRQPRDWFALLRLRCYFLVGFVYVTSDEETCDDAP